MPYGAEEASLRHQLVFLRRWWLVPVLLGALGASAAAILTSRQAPVYQATASITVAPPAGGQPDAGPGVRAHVADEVERMRSPEALAALGQVGDNPSRPPQVFIQAQPGTNVIDVRVRSIDPAEAFAAASQVAEGYVVWRTAKSAEEPAGAASGAVAWRGPAQEPTEPVSPGPLRNGALGLGGGLLIGLVLASLLDRVDDRLRRREDLEATVDLPVVGVLPREPLRQLQDGPLALLAPGSASAEAYAGLRANIEVLAGQRPMRCLQVTSAIAGEGTTTVATALAVSLARAGYRVIVIDADLRHPKVHASFGLGNTTGLAQVLTGERRLADAVASVNGEPCLAVLPAGPASRDPGELLATERFRAVVTTLRGHCDVLVFDGQPVLAGPDALVVARHANAILLVARPRQSTRRQVRRAHHLLHQMGAPVVGTVLNGAAHRAGAHRERRGAPPTLAVGSGPAGPAGEAREEVPS